MVQTPIPLRRVYLHRQFRRIARRDDGPGRTRRFTATRISLFDQDQTSIACVSRDKGTLENDALTDGPEIAFRAGQNK